MVGRRAGSEAPARHPLPRRFPKIEPSSPHIAQVFVSSPGGGGESMQLMYLLSIAAAAMKRGVKLQIIVPGPVIDNKVVRRASRAGWGELLRAGAEIHEYQPTRPTSTSWTRASPRSRRKSGLLGSQL